MLKDEAQSEYRINYSQSWEDPDLLTQSLEPGSEDTILSITSGGDNTLALLLHNPKSIIAIDSNPAQNYLLELKRAAIKYLSYEECISFLGIGIANDRGKQFQMLAQYISQEARSWWSTHTDLIEQGVMHSGKFEKYLSLFRNRILPLMHRKKDIDDFLSLQTVAEQKKFYDERWNNLRWRLLFRVFFNRTLLDLLGRQPHSFTYVDSKDIGGHYLKRAQHGFTDTPIVENYFLRFILTGTYDTVLPPYLERRNFENLKQNVDRVQLVTADIASFLKGCDDNTFDTFNLSDIFEITTPEQADNLFAELIRVGRPGGRIAYWNNLVQRQPSGILQSQLQENQEKAEMLYQKDRAFVYSSFHILTIKK
jgi:S-adenosylmethionine-diacylglycerol 3-amino-3-carboxypropyl transferase